MRLALAAAGIGVSFAATTALVYMLARSRVCSTAARFWNAAAADSFASVIAAAAPVLFVPRSTCLWLGRGTAAAATLGTGTLGHVEGLGRRVFHSLSLFHISTLHRFQR